MKERFITVQVKNRNKQKRHEIHRENKRIKEDCMQRRKQTDNEK
jgi:hypothetical protein